jgi:two-component system sensor kinase FixL
MFGAYSMSWITVVWSMLASASLTFALLHLFIYAKNIRPWANLAFAAVAIAAAIISAVELMAMQATSIEQVAFLQRWVHLPLLVLWVGIVSFVRFYFSAGRMWLAWTGGTLRLLALILSLTTGQNLFFKEITSLRQVSVWGGETISLAQGVLNPWYFIGPLSILFLVLFVLDATVVLWRREKGMNRRIIILSSSIIFFLLGSVIHTALVNMGVIHSTYLVSFFFMPILLSMSYELSYDMLQSVQIANRLRSREAELHIEKQRMQLAASAADLRLWEWDIVRDQIWSTDKTHTLIGLPEKQKISFDHFLNILYEEDRERVRLDVTKSFMANGDYESEYRIQMAGGQLHWFNSRGRIEFGENNRPLRMLGVTIDITRRKQMELEAQQLRNEMTHLSRVTLLGELSSSLAHELNQPLTSILSNAQAAQRFLALGSTDLAEVRNILDDIVAEDRRAADIIHRLRSLLKKGEIKHVPMDLNNMVHDVLKLINSDLINHNIQVDLDLDPNPYTVIGDRVQLQQVLLNLIMNGCDAMADTKAKNRQLLIRTALAGSKKVQMSVIDQGVGISLENVKSIFEPFFTTKAHGMGLGLSICRTIIQAHGGQLWVTRNIPRGSAFHFTLPIHFERESI